MNSLVMNPLGIIPLVISPGINPLRDEFHTGMNPYRTNRLWDQTGEVT
jgi:hypothetical protein